MPSYTLTIVKSSLLLASVLLTPRISFAGWVQVLPGSFDRVVASDTMAAVTRGGQVLIVEEHGDVRARIARSAGQDATRTPSARQEAEKILDIFEVSEADRDSDAVEDLLDGERTLARRRALKGAQHPSESVKSTVGLAASSQAIWVHSGGNLIRMDARHGAVRWPVTMSHPMLLAAKDAQAVLANASAVDVVSEAGASTRIAELPRAPDHLVATDHDARWAWAIERDVWLAGATGEPSHLSAPSGILDLAFCDGTLVALLDEGAYVVTTQGRGELRALPVPGRRLFCPRGRDVPWLVVGNALQVSFDQGHSWHAQSTPSGVLVVDLAASGNRLWLATTGGLYASSEAASPRLGSEAVRVRRRIDRPRTASWVGWLPKVSLRAGAVATSDKKEVEAFMLAAFPLDATTPVAARVDDSEETAHPAAGAEDQPTLMLAAGRDPDSVCLERARRRAVEIALSEPDRARSYVARAGRAAWLPELRMVISRRYGRSESLDVGTSSAALSSPLGIDTVNDIRYEARATWDLARLVFSPEELAAQTQALHMAELRREIEATMNRLYFERREIHLDRDSARRASLHRQVRGEAIDAELDAMSGGVFASCTSGRDVVAR
jgi:hypothetical protein